MKKQRKMMGGDEDELRSKIRKMEEDSVAVSKKIINTQEFKNKRERIVMNEEEKYI